MSQVRQGLLIHQATGAGIFYSYFLALLAEVYGKAGLAEEGLTALAEALTVADQSGERFYEAELYRLKGELTLRTGEKAKRGNGEKAQIPDLRAQILGPEGEAEACFLKAIEIAQKQQAKSLELRASTSLARLWQQQGKRAEAHRMLSAVYNWFTEGFDTKDLQEAKALLAVLVAGEEKTGEVAD
jgi:predicted ATPase